MDARSVKGKYDPDLKINSRNHEGHGGEQTLTPLEAAVLYTNI